MQIAQVVKKETGGIEKGRTRINVPQMLRLKGMCCSFHAITYAKYVTSRTVCENKIKKICINKRKKLEISLIAYIDKMRPKIQNALMI